MHTCKVLAERASAAVACNVHKMKEAPIVIGHHAQSF